MKTIYKFGNGSVLVSACGVRGFIQLTLIKPPLGYVGDLKQEDKASYIEICSVRIANNQTINTLSKLLRENQPFKFELCDSVLDFTDCAKESFDIVYKACLIAKIDYGLAYSC